ncbi:hypothetical protein Tco_0975371 [Tanacetum coccineum]|uniref:Uncharacterized protein n=1 Tax=Tanacetum coccineum TaxID=301880 RepID=A0ABQ5EE73_9ASTR
MKEKSTDFVTPTKASREAQDEEKKISLRSRSSKTLSKVAFTGLLARKYPSDRESRDKRRARYMAKKINTRLDAKEEINTGREEINTGSKEVSIGSTKVDSCTASKREDWDAIRAKLEANAELSKDVLGQDLPEQDFAKRMVDMNQGTWKLSQLKKLKFEEIKEEFDKLVQRIDYFLFLLDILMLQRQIWKRYGEEFIKEFNETKVDVL